MANENNRAEKFDEAVHVILEEMQKSDRDITKTSEALLPLLENFAAKGYVRVLNRFTEECPSLSRR